MVLSGRVWLVCAVLAAAAGVGLALWRTPHTVELPAAAEPDVDVPPASSASQPAPGMGPHMAPPMLGAAPPGRPGGGMQQVAGRAAQRAGARAGS